MDIANTTFEYKLYGIWDNIDFDFESEWSKKRCKWFFPKYRRKKLRNKVINRYKHQMFEVVCDVIDEYIPKKMHELFSSMIDVRDVPLGDRHEFAEEEVNGQIYVE